jgi:DNA polymerase I-like protein with 3'-5' exonuclease and polymerase domains
MNTELATIAKPHLAIDFETYYDDEYSVRKLGNWAYCNDPRFDAYLVTLCDGENTWAGHPTELDWEKLRGFTLISHNAFFDRTVYRRLVELGIAPPGLDADWQCSSNLAAYFCGGTRNLEFATSLMLGIEISKTVRNRASGKTVADMQSEGWYDQMLDYGRRDAQYCWMLWDKFAAKWPDKERRLSDLSIRNCERGIHVNKELLESYLAALQQALFQLERRIPWVDRGEKPTSPKQLAEECRACGIPVPPTKKDDEDGADKWVDTYGEKFEWVRSIGAWRSINKTLKRFLLVASRLRPDGTMDFGLKYFGAHSGRFSGDAGFNIQNQRKEPLLLNADFLPETRDSVLKAAFKQHDDTHAWPEWVAHIIDERALIVPGPGHRFVISDLSQIEPRVLNTLIGNVELIDKIRSGLGIYEAFARTALNYTDPAPLKSKDKKLYALAKAEVLGLGYQCGPGRFPEVAKAMAGIEISEEESIRIVAEFRKANPKIVDLWNTLDVGFKRSVGSDFTMDLPNGRQMIYREVKAQVRPELDEETGDVRLKRVTTALVGERRMSFYGGKLTENITQAVARDIFVEMILALDEAGVHVPFSVHDEVICRVPVEEAEAKKAVVERIMSIPPAWMPDVPVACEAQLADRYLK